MELCWIYTLNQSKSLIPCSYSENSYNFDINGIFKFVFYVNIDGDMVNLNNTPSMSMIGSDEGVDDRF